MISAFNSLTLSPALSAVLLRAHDAPKDGLTRTLDRLLGWLFRPFNRFFNAAAGRYVKVVRSVIRRSSLAVGVYLALLGLTWVGFQNVPSGFVPIQDKQYLVSFARSRRRLARSGDEVIRRMSRSPWRPKGEHAISFPVSPSPVHQRPQRRHRSSASSPEERKAKRLSGSGHRHHPESSRRDQDAFWR